MSQKPNIIFYFSDQQRWDTLGCYGQKLNITPNLDKIASEGTKFEYAFTVQPVCGPARACIQSGKYATDIGCYKNGIALPLNIKTLAQYFNGSGYDTAYVGKWHLATDSDKGINYETTAIPQERRGGYKDYWMASDVLEFTSHGYNGYVFDKNNEKVEFIGYRPECINNYAIDYIHNRNSNNPFFMFISHIEPHHQNDRGRFEGPYGSKKKFNNYDVPEDLENAGQIFDDNYSDYLGCCNSLDTSFGKLLNALEEKNILDNTIIFYTSDHGCHFKTRNSEYKRSCHEDSIRIPMIAYGPGFMGGNVINNLVSLIDIPTTLLDCAGIDKPKDFSGNSLKKLVNKEIQEWSDEVFIQISESQVGRALRTKKWKYSVKAKEDGYDFSCSKEYFEEFLYDLETDPYEKNNLVSDDRYIKQRQELAQILKNKIFEVEKIEVEIYNL